MSDTDGQLFVADERRFCGPNLRSAMVLRQITIDELYRKTGINRSTVYSALAGRRVSDKTAIAILAFLGRTDPVKVA